MGRDLSQEDEIFLEGQGGRFFTKDPSGAWLTFEVDVLSQNCHILQVYWKNTEVFYEE